MKWNRSDLLFSVLMLTILPALANNDCSNNGDFMADSANCLNKDADQAEKQLKEIYLRLGKVLRNAKDADGKPVSLRQQLLVSQRQWLKYREETCKLEGQPALAGNPTRSTLYAQGETACKARLTRARTQELKSFGDEYELW